MAPIIRAVLTNLISEEEASSIDIIANDVEYLDEAKTGERWEIVYRHPESGFGHDKSKAILPYRDLPHKPTLFFCGDGVSGAYQSFRGAESALSSRDFRYVGRSSCGSPVCQGDGQRRLGFGCILQGTRYRPCIFQRLVRTFGRNCLGIADKSRSHSNKVLEVVKSIVQGQITVKEVIDREMKTERAEAIMEAKAEVTNGME